MKITFNKVQSKGKRTTWLTLVVVGCVWSLKLKQTKSAACETKCSCRLTGFGEFQLKNVNRKQASFKLGSDTTFEPSEGTSQEHSSFVWQVNQNTQVCTRLKKFSLIWSQSWPISLANQGICQPGSAPTPWFWRDLFFAWSKAISLSPRSVFLIVGKNQCAILSIQPYRHLIHISGDCHINVYRWQLKRITSEIYNGGH